MNDMLNEYKIIDKVLGLPLSSSEGTSLQLGAYKTRHNNVEVEHALIYSSEIQNPTKPILLRINSACFTGDIFHDQRCDCNWQLHHAIRKIKKEPGLIIYHFHHEGKALGFTNKLKILKILESEGLSPVEANLKFYGSLDDRRYFSSLKILEDLGIKQVKLISNNPHKKRILETHGIEVVKTISIVSKAPHLKNYLEWKRDRLGHQISWEN